MTIYHRMFQKLTKQYLVCTLELFMKFFFIAVTVYIKKKIHIKNKSWGNFSHFPSLQLLLPLSNKKERKLFQLNSITFKPQHVYFWCVDLVCALSWSWSDRFFWTPPRPDITVMVDWALKINYLDSTHSPNWTDMLLLTSIHTPYGLWLCWQFL